VRIPCLSIMGRKEVKGDKLDSQTITPNPFTGSSTKKL
jgi:hypothetical protein